MLDITMESITDRMQKLYSHMCIYGRGEESARKHTNTQTHPMVYFLISHLLHTAVCLANRKNSSVV